MDALLCAAVLNLTSQKVATECLHPHEKLRVSPHSIAHLKQSNDTFKRESFQQFPKHHRGHLSLNLPQILPNWRIHACLRFSKRNGNSATNFMGRQSRRSPVCHGNNLPIAIILKLEFYLFTRHLELNGRKWKQASSAFPTSGRALFLTH